VDDHLAPPEACPPGSTPALDRDALDRRRHDSPKRRDNGASDSLRGAEALLAVE
jgi:hypothetical protein